MDLHYLIMMAGKVVCRTNVSKYHAKARLDKREPTALHFSIHSHAVPYRYLRRTSYRTQLYRTSTSYLAIELDYCYQINGPLDLHVTGAD